MDFQDMRIFARVAALQNLSAVGAEIGLTTGTVSKRLQAIEDQLGVRLFDRTTRSIRITEEGKTFLEYAERILAEMDSAKAAMGDKLATPQGMLRISVPGIIGRRYLSVALCEFLDLYPNIRVHVDLDDSRVNLLEEGYHVAIRTGALSDSSLIAKRLISDTYVILASPSYIARHGDLRHPNDLVNHNCLVMGDIWQWTFRRGTDDVSVRVQGFMRSNSADMLRHAAVKGLGVLRTSAIKMHAEIRSGELVRVLPDWHVGGDAAIWAVYPSAKLMPPKLRVFLDFLADWFRKQDLALPDMPQSSQQSGRPDEIMVKAGTGLSGGGGNGHAAPRRATA